MNDTEIWDGAELALWFFDERPKEPFYQMLVPNRVDGRVLDLSAVSISVDATQAISVRINVMRPVILDSRGMRPEWKRQCAFWVIYNEIFVKQATLSNGDTPCDIS